MKPVLPRVASTTPFKVEVSKDEKYSWCTCGYSAKEPFCDGAHKEFKDSEGNSLMRSLKFIAEENKTVWLCGCKHTKNPPFCDGSHKMIESSK